MAMTQQVKAELATLEVAKPELRKAEVAALLRFANGLHIAGGRIVVEAELTPAPPPAGCGWRSPSSSVSPPSSW